MPHQQFGRVRLGAVVWYCCIVDAGYIIQQNKIHWHCFADLAAVAGLKHPKNKAQQGLRRTNLLFKHSFCVQ